MDFLFQWRFHYLIMASNFLKTKKNYFWFLIYYVIWVFSFCSFRMPASPREFLAVSSISSFKSKLTISFYFVGEIFLRWNWTVILVFLVSFPIKLNSGKKYLFLPKNNGVTEGIIAITLFHFPQLTAYFRLGKLLILFGSLHFSFFYYKFFFWLVVNNIKTLVSLTRMYLMLLCY